MNETSNFIKFTGNLIHVLLARNTRNCVTLPVSYFLVTLRKYGQDIIRYHFDQSYEYHGRHKETGTVGEVTNSHRSLWLLIVYIGSCLFNINCPVCYHKSKGLIEYTWFGHYFRHLSAMHMFCFIEGILFDNVIKWILAECHVVNNAIWNGFLNTLTRKT